MWKSAFIRRSIWCRTVHQDYRQMPGKSRKENARGVGHLSNVFIRLSSASKYSPKTTSRWWTKHRVMIRVPSEFGWHKSERLYAVGWFGNRATNIFRLSADDLVGLADFWLLKIIRNTRKALLLAELRNITSQKKLPITPAKPQAATQAITPSLRPRPSYPL